MDFKILYFCPIGFYPLREEARHSSQMVSQILKGEWYEVLESNDHNWHKIRLFHDGYEGWISCRKHYLLENQIETGVFDGESFVLRAKRKISGNDIGEVVGFSTNIENDNTKGDLFIKTAKDFLHTPYLWGGRTSGGIDCSGLTQIIHYIHNISLPRDAYQQAECGQTIEKLSDVGNGDLVFFAENGIRISHVGLLFWEEMKLKIIHASNEVKIEDISEQGIFNVEIQDYTLKPIQIKRNFKS